MCHFSSFWGEGVTVFLWHESGAQGLSAHCNTRKLENIFPSLSFPLAPLSSPGWRVCPHLCWDKSSCVSGFSHSLLCLKWNIGPLLWPNLSQTGIVIIGYPRETELTQSETPPTAITDSIILSKGTWSINDIHLILSSINSSKRSLKFKDYGNVTVFEGCLYSMFFIFNCSRTIRYSNHRPLSCYS